jgi:branched-chain amino acid transport system substrate-binding protein
VDENLSGIGFDSLSNAHYRERLTLFNFNTDNILHLLKNKSILFYLIILIVLLLAGIGSKSTMAGIHAEIKSLFGISENSRPSTNNVEEIRIGLLLPQPPEKDLLARSALQGAELAIEQANADGGYNGQPFKLIVRTADGLWGAGSKESVKLVHEDGVVGIVTAVDGRNAHLAEQVAAKSHVAQVATRASEETLSQAYVPWFFRIVPNDLQQAEALIMEIYERQGFSKIHLLYEEGYDQENASKSFKKIAEKQGHNIYAQSVYRTSKADMFNPGVSDDTEALVVFGSFNVLKPVLDEIKEQNLSIKIYGGLMLTADGLIGTGYSTGCEGGIFVSSKFCFTTSGQTFKNLYKAKYNKMPNPAASYTYDGVNLVIEAVKQSGPDREKIRDTLKAINYTQGATGPIQFDQNGNRTSPAFLIKIIKGHPVILNP